MEWSGWSEIKGERERTTESKLLSQILLFCSAGAGGKKEGKEGSKEGERGENRLSR